MHTAEHPIQPEEVMALFDGELAPDRAPDVRAHVLTCQQCRALSGELAQVSRDLASWTIAPPPGTFHASAAAETDPRSASAWWPHRVFPRTAYSVTGAALAGLLLVLAVGWRSGRQARPDAPPAVTAAVSAETGDPSPLSYSEALRPVSPGNVSLGGRPVGGNRNGGGPPRQTAVTPRIVRTCSLAMTTRDFDRARPAIDQLLSGAGGFVGSLQVTGAAPGPRRLSAELRVPADRLSAILADLRTLGTVTAERQSADDVTDQLIDLEARIANGRSTEKRLDDLLQRRTGSLSDVLDAEREVARVREEIERLDAQRSRIDGRVTYATIMVEISEQQKSTLTFGPLPLSTRLRNAAVDGVRSAFGSIADALVLLLRIGPVIAVWVAAIGATLVVGRRARHRLRAPTERTPA